MHKDLGFRAKIQVVLFYILSLQDLTGKRGGHMVNALTFDEGPRSSTGERCLFFFVVGFVLGQDTLLLQCLSQV